MEESPPSSKSVLDMVPLTIDERRINRFKFYFNYAVRTGMQYDRELYGLINEVSQSARLEAYRLGCELLMQGLPILITASKHRYALWLNLHQASANNHDFLK